MAFVRGKHEHRIEDLAGRRLDGCRLHVLNDVWIRDDLAVFRDDEAAPQDIARFSFAFNDHDGGRYPLCNLSGRESVLAKCYGQGCGYYEGNGNSGEHKAGLSAPILSRGQYDFWEPILTGRHLSLLAFGAATSAKFIPGWSSNTIIGGSPMGLYTREVAVPEASGSGGCSRRSGQYSRRRPLPQTQHGGISDPAPPLPFPTTRPFDWTSSLLLRSNPQRLHLPVQVTALQPE